MRFREGLLGIPSAFPIDVYMLPSIMDPEIHPELKAHYKIRLVGGIFEILLSPYLGTAKLTIDFYKNGTELEITSLFNLLRWVNSLCTSTEQLYLQWGIGDAYDSWREIKSPNEYLDVTGALTVVSSALAVKIYCGFSGSLLVGLDTLEQHTKSIFGVAKLIELASAGSKALSDKTLFLRVRLPDSTSVLDPFKNGEYANKVAVVIVNIARIGSYDFGVIAALIGRPEMSEEETVVTVEKVVVEDKIVIDLNEKIDRPTIQVAIIQKLEGVAHKYSEEYTVIINFDMGSENPAT